ncbi:MAG TPA: hypothetical protein VKR31_11430 [Rhizomicrobium sp.]|nr:hypothetical protein [Rhizomicrobium sp.]
MKHEPKDLVLQSRTLSFEAWTVLRELREKNVSAQRQIRAAKKAIADSRLTLDFCRQSQTLPSP